MEVHDKFVLSIAKQYAHIYNTEGAMAAQRYSARIIGDDKKLKARVRTMIKAIALGK